MTIKPIKTRLMLPEYGRNVQEMVNYLKTIEDRDKRNEQAKIVVAIMGNIYPYKRDSEEFRHMLWDHLFMIADFDIDIDSPYPKPTMEVMVPKPERLQYKQNHFVQKQYGFLARKMIRKIVESNESAEDKNAAILFIAKYIRQQAYNYNHEYPSNDTIANDIQCVCGNDFEFDANLLSTTKVDVQPTQQRNRNNNHKKSGQSQQQRSNNNNKNRSKK